MSARTCCPACRCSQIRSAFHVGGFAIVRCDECRSLFVRQPPSSAEIQSIYLDQAYYTHDPGSIERIRSENGRRCRLLTRLTEGRKLLDVGCAAGFLLDAAKASGFEVQGVDQTPHTVALAKSHGHQVFLGTLDDLTRRHPEHKGSFDVVTALDVIEHVPEPLEFLRQVVDLARPGGIVVLSTPNYSGLVARLMGPRDPYLIPPEHLNFFTLSGLKALAARTGVHVERTETFGRLTALGMRRMGARFLPGFLMPLHLPFGWMIGMGIQSLNLVKAGIEAEVYLRKPAATPARALAPAA
jgi:2-polyprenyl-3-methyl-5-hydroxy-6-metoxy-1,4-benzoquinol methylase